MSELSNIELFFLFSLVNFLPTIEERKFPSKYNPFNLINCLFLFDIKNLGWTRK